MRGGWEQRFHRAWIALAVAALAAGPVPGLAEEAAVDSSAGPIVVQNAYYPKPGLEAEVLATRLEASAVRARLGLVVGRVLLRDSGPEGGPYVVWEAEYTSPEARRRDVEELEKSAEFDAVADRMGALLARFERSVWRVVGEQPPPS